MIALTNKLSTHSLSSKNIILRSLVRKLIVLTTLSDDSVYNFLQPYRLEPDSDELFSYRWFYYVVLWI